MDFPWVITGKFNHVYNRSTGENNHGVFLWFKMDLIWLKLMDLIWI